MSPGPSLFLLQKNRVFQKRQLITVAVMGLAFFDAQNQVTTKTAVKKCKGEKHDELRRV